MKKLSLTFMIACFLFSTIFIAAGCAKKLPVASPSVEEKKAAAIKPEAEEVQTGRTYEEETVFQRFFLKRRAESQ